MIASRLALKVPFVALTQVFLFKDTTRRSSMYLVNTANEGRHVCTTAITALLRSQHVMSNHIA